MFKTIARLLSSRAPSAPRFVPPDNKHTESVPPFRAHLREIGLTEAEASAVVVNRVVAGMVHLRRATKTGRTGKLLSLSLPD